MACLIVRVYLNCSCLFNFFIKPLHTEKPSVEDQRNCYAEQSPHVSR